MRRFAIFFAAFFLVGIGVLWTSPVQTAVEKFSAVLVTGSAAVIRIFGGKVLTEGVVLRDAVGGFAIEMRNGCNAINVMILLWSAVVAFPASPRQKLQGILAGSLLIQGINVIRFISLFYLGRYSMSLFEFAHEYLWETLIILDTIVIFWLWVRWVSRSGAAVQDAAR
jgi:exosortase H (IPTLxxWG-CTERM-specific)